MSTTNPGHNGGVLNQEGTYEHRDLSARGIVGFLIGLAIIGLLIHLGLLGFYKYVAGRGIAGSQMMVSVPSDKETAKPADPAAIFSAPRLQPDPVSHLDKFRLHEEQTLNSYGWVDQQKGIVHIPIERAMEMLAQQGLPVRPAQGTKP